MSLAACATHVNYVTGPDNFPYYGINTTQNGTGQSAKYVEVFGGSFAAKTTAFHTTNSPGVEAISTMTATFTGAFGTGVSYSHVTSL